MIHLNKKQMDIGGQRKSPKHVLIIDRKDYFFLFEERERQKAEFLTERETKRGRENEGDGERDEKEKEGIHKHTHNANRSNIKNICSGSTLHTRQYYRRVVCVSLCSRVCRHKILSYCVLHIFAFTSSIF